MTAPAQWHSRWVKLGAIRTHYVEAGDGPPVLLIHGGGPGSSGEYGWGPVIPALARRFRVLAIDQLGFGETDKPTGIDYGEQDRVGLVAAFVDTLCLAPVRLVGNSMGAYVAVRHALDHPDEVQRIFMLGSGTLAQAMGLEFKPPRWEYLGTKESLREGLQSTLLHPVSDELVEGRLRLARLPGSAEAHQAQMAYNRRLRQEPNLRQRFMVADRLPQLTIPMRMLWGAQDRFAPVELAHQLEKLLPNVDFEILEGAGHQCQHDAPDEVARRIAEFFEP